MKKQICKNCAYYSAYYKQMISGFDRLSFGHCSNHNKQQVQHETCGHFKSNEQKEQKRKKLRIMTLDQTLTSIKNIVSILNENKKDLDSGEEN